MAFGLGLGVPQDYETAVKWMTLAAEQGSVMAQNEVGMMYYNGRGVPQDYKTAVKWYTLAAEQGFPGAQKNLGVMYFLGEGLIQDDVYAHMWLNIAASLRDKTASENRDIVAERMTPSQLEEAQRLARECVAKNYKGC
jgi:TPR repeat protein